MVIARVINCFRELCSTEVQKNEIASRGLFKGRRYSMLDVDGKDPVKRNKLTMEEGKGELLEQCYGAEVT